MSYIVLQYPVVSHAWDVVELYEIRETHVTCPMVAFRQVCGMYDYSYVIGWVCPFL
jgi:hypothetical protein